MDWFWLWIDPLLPAILVVLAMEYRAWRDRVGRRATLERLDRIAAALEREL